MTITPKIIDDISIGKKYDLYITAGLYTSMNPYKMDIILNQMMDHYSKAVHNNTVRVTKIKEVKDKVRDKIQSMSPLQHRMFSI